MLGLCWESWGNLLPNCMVGVTEYVYNLNNFVAPYNAVELWLKTGVSCANKIF